MLRTLATSLLRSGKVTQIQNCAGIFTTTRLRQNVDEENDTEARRPPNFEKSLNSVTLLGKQFILCSNYTLITYFIIFKCPPSHSWYKIHRLFEST